MQNIIKTLLLICITTVVLNSQELKKSKYDITQCIKITYTKEDIKKYKELIQEGELQGYSCAGIYYMRQGDFKEAINYFNKGKEKGSIEAYAQLGSLYSSFLHDYKKAVKNYKIAANAGHGKSAHNLGVYYYKNFKYDEAYKWFMKSYETGDMNSLISIGLMYIDQKKYDEAINTFKKVGKLGEPRGYYELGIFYRKNKARKNDKEGIKYYKKCYEMGYGLCAGAIGQYYEEDRKDYKKAEEWYKKGFELKNEESINRLGFMYLKDLNNPKKAIYWFKEGYKKIKCKSCIEIIAKTYIINLEDYPNAIKWYKINYKENNSPQAVYNLGLLHEYSKNKEEAIKWYKKACNYNEVKILAEKKLKELGVSYE